MNKKKLFFQIGNHYLKFYEKLELELELGDLFICKIWDSKDFLNEVVTVSLSTELIRISLYKTA